MKSGKQHMTDGVKQPNQDKIKTLRWMLWDIGGIKQVEMKDKIQKEYLRRSRKLLKTTLSLQKPYQRNKYLGCNSR